jgi:hypothetical protein
MAEGADEKAALLRPSRAISPRATKAMNIAD